MSRRVVVTGSGALCAAGAHCADIWAAACAGHSALTTLSDWGASRRGGVVEIDARTLVEDRKLPKLLRRSDMYGLYAAARAIDDAGLIAYRDTLADRAVATFNDRTGVFVGAGGSAYQNQYDFFPLLDVAGDDLPTFGRELPATVNPMWLLRSLPNNVLCHVGIRFGFKGANACITNHSVSGLLAVSEAASAIRAGEVERAVAIGHDAPVEPQAVLYFERLGLLATECVRPFDAARSGSLLGDGAGALLLETAEGAAARGATVLGEILGSGCASEAGHLLAIREDGDGLARAMTAALDDAGLDAADVGMIVAHGNGTRRSDASEAAAIGSVFGAAAPPVTAFKWAFGHLIAAAGVVESVLALHALRAGVVPGIATLREVDPACAHLPVLSAAQAPRSDVALILSRGFAGMNVVLAVRAAHGGRLP